LGHGYGDKVLANFSGTIRELAEQTDILGRYSGDEFVILTCDTAYGLLNQKVDVLLQHFSQPIYIDGQSIYISASIGVSVYPDHANTASELMVYADLAMYEAKKRGKNNVCIFNAEMQEYAQRQMQLKNALQYSLETNSIEVFYQPIINTDNRQVAKIEALMRCPDSAGGYFNTEELIQICEETNTIFEIDIAVLKRVNEDIESIINQCRETTVGISLNVSPNIFTSQTDLINEWLFWLYELAAKTKVTLEITERALLDKNSDTLTMFQDFNKRGIDIAIDDFGVGYSSLISLVDFPISVIKIDRSFVEKLTEDDSHYNQLINSIVTLADTLNLEVIAEGVEVVYQANQLAQYGCHKLQGYYFSKAIDKQAVIEFINHSKKSND
jgi:FOG: EAL domain